MATYKLLEDFSQSVQYGPQQFSKTFHKGDIINGVTNVFSTDPNFVTTNLDGTIPNELINVKNEMDIPLGKVYLGVPLNILEKTKDEMPTYLQKIDVVNPKNITPQKPRTFVQVMAFPVILSLLAGFGTYKYTPEGKGKIVNALSAALLIGASTFAIQQYFHNKKMKG